MSSIASELRDRWQETCKEAQKRWAAFQTYRDANMAALKQGDKDVFDEAEKLHDAYSEVASEAKALEQRVLDAKKWDGDPSSDWTSKKERPDGIEFGRLDGLAKKFIEDHSSDGTAGGLKALVSGASPVAPFWDERIRQLPQRARFMRSLIPVVPTDSDSFNYVRQTVRTIAAAPVAAGAVKPTSTITIEKVTGNVQYIAHLTEPIDRAILLDYDSLEGFLDAEMRYGVLFKEDDQLLNGNGTPPNLPGILTTAGILSQARGADAHHEAFYKAITAVRNQDSPYEPDAIVMSPLAWQTIRLAKAADGTNLTAPIVESDPDRLWGKPVVTTRAIADTVGLVGAFGVGAKVYDREAAMLELATSGALGSGGVEIFSRNLVVGRAEERIGFAVERPAAFCQVTGL